MIRIMISSQHLSDSIYLEFYYRSLSKVNFWIGKYKNDFLMDFIETKPVLNHCYNFKNDICIEYK